MVQWHTLGLSELLLWGGGDDILAVICCCVVAIVGLSAGFELSDMRMPNTK